MPVNINLLPDEVIARGVPPPDISKGFEGYFAGADRAQQQRLQNLFSDIQIDPKTGIPYGELARRLLQAGGAPQAPAAIGLLNQEALRNVSALPTTDPGLTSPSQVQPYRPPLPPSPQRGGTLQTAPVADSGSVADSGGTPAPPGQNVVRSDEVPNTAQMSVDGGPFAPIQQKPVKTASMTTARALAEGSKQDVQTVADALGVQPDQGISVDEVRQKLPALRQQLAGGPQAPPQVTIPARPQEQPVEDLSAQSRQGPTVSAPIRNENDPGYYTIDNAKAYQARGRLLEASANQMAGIQGGEHLAAGRQKAADNEFAIAKQILDVVGENVKQTPDIKAYNLGKQPGETLPQYQARIAGTTEQSKKLGEQFAQQSATIREAGDKAETAIPQLQIVQRSTLDPKFYSGFAANRVLLAKQFIGALGGDPNTAAPMQVADALLSGSILSGLKAVVQGTGQVRSAELGLMRSQAAAPTDSPEAYRTKVEVALRVQQRARDLADLAQNYKGGNLDAGFGQQVKTLPPLFTANELKNPKLLAYPKFNSPQEAAAANLPVGTRFRDDKDNFRLVP